MSDQGAFGRDYVAPEKPLRGVKLTNKKSPEKQRASSREEFEKNANQFMENKQEQIKIAIELAKQFKEILQDKTLVENKGPISKEIEKDVISKLIALAMVINQDESQPEGYGSVAIIQLLLKMMLSQRDAYNELDFKVSRLERLLTKKSPVEPPAIGA